MRKRPSFTRRDRLRYRVDNALTTGDVWWVIVWLAALILGFLLLMATLIGALGLTDESGREFGYVEGFWQALLRALDPGTMASDCLLYTSPSPRDRTRSRMPSSA